MVTGQKIGMIDDHLSASLGLALDNSNVLISHHPSHDRKGGGLDVWCMTG